MVIVNPGLQRISNELLHFWTSNATVHIKRAKPEFKLRATISINEGHEVLEKAHVSIHAWDVKDRMGYHAQKQRDETESNTMADLIVVCEDSVGMDVWIVGLVVGWKEQVAYRIGNFSMPEEDWMKMKDLSWRQVALG
jgi:hypothetical protein